MTLDEIKEQVASDDNFHNWQLLFESCAMFDYGRLESAIDKVAQSYAQSQAQELKEQNEELVEMLSKVLEVNKHHSFNGHLINEQIEVLLTKHNRLKTNTNDTDKS